MIEIIILSFVQGVAEFIPVSSSSHLILMSNLLNFENQSLSIDVSLHIGSLLAVLVYFYKDIISFVENKILFFKIFISSLPVVFVGFLLVETGIIDQIRDVKIIRSRLVNERHINSIIKPKLGASINSVCFNCANTKIGEYLSYAIFIIEYHIEEVVTSNEKVDNKYFFSKVLFFVVKNMTIMKTIMKNFL